MRNPQLLLRVAIAGAFLYPAIAALMVPAAWLGYFPHFVLGIVPDTVLIIGWSIVEAVLAFWILSGRNIFVPALLAAILLAAIVIVNLSLIDIVFRDVALAFVALYLALTSRR
ncbi:MAG TPA: hypothetical protein VN086_00820 [Candidatus Paceibacterota bacterium]|nr:hypothetical protein [Candidatus Paceibacterota bacterium]